LASFELTYVGLSELAQLLKSNSVSIWTKNSWSLLLLTDNVLVNYSQHWNPLMLKLIINLLCGYVILMFSML